MSEESTRPDLVGMHRAMVEAAAGQDIDGAMLFFAPDAVWNTGATHSGGIYEGAAEIRSFVDDWLDVLDGLEISVLDVSGFGDDVTLIAIEQRIQPPGGTALIEESFQVVAKWLNGRVTDATNYRDIAEARAAAKQLARERG